MNLDLGCGPGYVDKLYGNTVGVDRNLSECLSYHRLLGLPAVCADATQLPFRRQSFDLVTCHQMIEHVWNEQGVIAEINRVRRGKVIISSVIRKWWGFYLYRGKDGKWGRLSWDHCREYRNRFEFKVAVWHLGNVEIRQEPFRFSLLDLIRNVLNKIKIPIPGFVRITAETKERP